MISVNIVIFLPLTFSHYYQWFPIPSICCSQFFAQTFWVTFNAIPIIISVFIASFSPPLSGHLLSLPRSYLPFFPYDHPIIFINPLLTNFFLKHSFTPINLHSLLIHSSLISSILLTRLFTPINLDPFYAGEHMS